MMLMMVMILFETHLIKTNITKMIASEDSFRIDENVREIYRYFNIELLSWKNYVSNELERKVYDMFIHFGNEKKINSEMKTQK